MNPVKKQLVYVPIAQVILTNSKTSWKRIDWLARHLNMREFKALPAWWNGHGYMLTDGNHRTQAAKLAGFDYVPVVLLTKAEFDFVKFSERSIDMLVCAPEKPIVLSIPPANEVDVGILNQCIEVKN